MQSVARWYPGQFFFMRNNFLTRSTAKKQTFDILCEKAGMLCDLPLLHDALWICLHIRREFIVIAYHTTCFNFLFHIHIQIRASLLTLVTTAKMSFTSVSTPCHSAPALSIRYFNEMINFNLFNFTFSTYYFT